MTAINRAIVRHYVWRQNPHDAQWGATPEEDNPTMPTNNLSEVIARLRELDAKATPGPWASERQDDEDGSINYEVWTEAPGKYKPLFTIREYYDSRRRKEDAALIAYIRTNLAALLDAAEAGMKAPLPATKEAVQRIKDMGDERDARIRNEALEEAAKVIEPTGLCPCDCTEILDGWHVARCICGNSGDAAEIASWCSSMNDAARIRALKVKP